MPNAGLSILTITLAYTIYYFAWNSPSLRKWFDKKYGEAPAKIKWIYFVRWNGVAFFGVLSLAICLFQGIDLQSVGLGFKNWKPTLGWTIGLSAVVTVMNYFAARSPDNLVMYPMIRTRPPWPNSLLVGSAFTWAMYLLAYEFAFRGFLFFTCRAVMDLPLAIAVNISLYVLVHIAKGWKEAVGAVPLGIVLCLLTEQTGTIWIAFLVHVAMAWGNEWWSYYWTSRNIT
ncbi:MAG: CPBP family intramembrane metalloprotease [Saprospiraceae bacterium]|nr:CPBP family intramembrane metalloprotease [Saprospiraceae bacterium]